METDEQLVVAYRSGDEEAFETLVKRYTKPLYYFCRRFARGSIELHDIVQETLIKVWRSIGRVGGHISLKPWIYKIAHHTALDHLRKKKIPTISDFDSSTGNVLIDTIADPAPLPDEQFITTERIGHLRQSIDKLSPIYKEVLYFRLEQQLTFEEISAKTGFSINTIKSRYRRALRLIDPGTIGKKRVY